jgi:hypothetical protein
VLAAASGHAKSNLSRTRRTMARDGLVRLERGERRLLKPVVTFQSVALTLNVATQVSRQSSLSEHLVRTQSDRVTTSGTDHRPQTRRATGSTLGLRHFARPRNPSATIGSA